MSRLTGRMALLQVALATLTCGWLIGCGEPESTVDSAPFESAIAKYLDQNNMGMAVKEVKEGPTVTGETATLVASLTRADVGGPSVTWTFRFEKNPDGTWKAVSHED
ncbi:MAG TPA: hypothetical protein VMY37_20795 [Thermoguttaceae bacterium]|nr:hypothetical protein [Thermoguttaceae bacterium]